VLSGDISSDIEHRKRYDKKKNVISIPTFFVGREISCIALK